MSLVELRRAIGPLLDEQSAADAMAAYYAFYHADKRTRLVAGGAGTARGYVAASRTGIDLFRPLVTMRLPLDEPEVAADIIYEAFSPGTSMFIHCPVGYRPLLGALFQIESEQRLRLLQLSPQQFEREVNVLVMRSSSPDGSPRFLIRTGPEQEIGAAAGLNWLSPQFADVHVHTNPDHRQRGWGRSVVTALAGYLLERGVTPLYEVAPDNDASLHLAHRVGFRDTGHDKLLLEGTLRGRP